MLSKFGYNLKIELIDASRFRVSYPIDLVLSIGQLFERNYKGKSAANFKL